MTSDQRTQKFINDRKVMSEPLHVVVFVFSQKIRRWSWYYSNANNYNVTHWLCCATQVYKKNTSISK